MSSLKKVTSGPQVHKRVSLHFQPLSEYVVSSQNIFLQMPTDLKTSIGVDAPSFLCPHQLFVLECSTCKNDHLSIHQNITDQLTSLSNTICWLKSQYKFCDFYIYKVLQQNTKTQSIFMQFTTLWKICQLLQV